MCLSLRGKSHVWPSPSSGPLSPAAQHSRAILLSSLSSIGVCVCLVFFVVGVCVCVFSCVPVIVNLTWCPRILHFCSRPWSLPAHPSALTATPADVRSQPSPGFLTVGRGPPVPSELSPGFRAELLGQDLLPRFLGSPASVPDCRGRAAWDAEAPEPFGGHRGAAVRMGLRRRTRGAPGRPRWSQARRWRIFGAHCAA